MRRGEVASLLVNRCGRAGRRLCCGSIQLNPQFHQCTRPFSLFLIDTDHILSVIRRYSLVSLSLSRRYNNGYHEVRTPVLLNLVQWERAVEIIIGVPKSNVAPTGFSCLYHKFINQKIECNFTSSQLGNNIQ